LISPLLRIVFSGRNKKPKGQAIFLDRDGVINCRRPDNYVLDWSEFIFVPGIRAALKQLSSLQLPMIVISNQAAVGKGLMAPAALESITIRFQKSLAADGINLTATYYCTHRSDENCACRKPAPALLEQAAADFNIDLGRSIFVGDSETDILAAQSVGCNPIFFGWGCGARSGSLESSRNVPVVNKAEDLFDVAVACLQNDVKLVTADNSVRGENDSA